MLLSAGLVAHSERFNTLHGHRRLVFVGKDARIPPKVDVFVGDLEMCHIVPLRRRLEQDPLTLSPTDLLLSKGQIAQLTAKDRLDIYCLLWNHELDAGYVAALCARDWGWWRTLSANLAACRQGLSELAALGADERALIDSRLQMLDRTIEASPKSLRWRARNRVGDRVRWFEEPEEIAALPGGTPPAASSPGGP